MAKTYRRDSIYGSARLKHVKSNRRNANNSRKQSYRTKEALRNRK